MAHLGGQFAGMLFIETAGEHVDTLINSLKTLESDGLTVTAVPGQSSFTPTDSPGADEAIEVELVGQDRTGIVRQITASIAACGANIEDLATECFSAPMSGERMFRATARVHLPQAIDAATLQSDLEAIAHDLMVDLSVAR